MINVLLQIVANMKNITRLLKSMKNNQMKTLKLRIMTFEIKNARNRFNNRLDVKREDLVNHDL